MAARQQHVAEVIRPGLARGAVVISDRYTDATVGLPGVRPGARRLETIRDLNVLATGGVLPDLTIVLDLDPVAGMRRIRRPRARRLRADGPRLPSPGPARATSRSRGPTRAGSVLLADEDPDALHADVLAAVDERLAGRGNRT